MNYSFDDIHTLNALSDRPADQERFSLPPDLKVMAALVCAATAALLIAAVTLHVDKVVSATGVFETELGVFPVRNMQAGYVKSVAVREGERVKTGQVLIEFDSRLIDLEIERVQADMSAMARSVWSDVTMLQAALSAEDRAALLSKVAVVPNPMLANSLTSGLTQQLPSMARVFAEGQRSAGERAQQLQAQIALTQESIASLSQDVRQSQQLVADGFESQASLASKKRQLLDLEARKRGLQNEQQTVVGEKVRLSAESARQLNELTTDRLRKIDEATGNYRRNEFQLQTQQRLREGLVVKAPFDGVVDQLALKGPQEFIPENSPLISLRRDSGGQPLEIDILMPSDRAVWVQQGMAFRASAAGNNPEDHGYVRGAVSFISKSTEMKDGARVFRLRGRIDEYHLKNPGAKESFLRPGMGLRVEVITGTRSLLNYVIDPFAKTLREAAREPN